MTIPVSTIPAALAGLQALVAAQVATDASAAQVVVCVGEPGMDLPNDIIQLGTDVRRTVKPETFIGSFAAQALDEQYDIECKVSSWSGDPDPVAVINRAYQLAGYIETAVRTDPTLGGVVLEAYPSGTGGGNAEWSGDPVGRLAELTVTIHIENLT
jgi:hypothetical protein